MVLLLRWLLVGVVLLALRSLSGSAAGAAVGEQVPVPRSLRTDCARRQGQAILPIGRPATLLGVSGPGYITYRPPAQAVLPIGRRTQAP